ncbi:methionine ABC transporter permease [Clostridium botulinum]|uniref:D-methionine ABC transporter, permease protein n=2 Tax=Clostridium botulinum TaxID=1491 RepID=A5I0S7_CLOBH|nr:methionine ABC transporter permease [Clostridium botulinum]EKN41023.1 methionine ABC transporter permease [Clostridium botulinum CFSAN001627]EPS50846.1 methionine ABC transporter permease [Clostridium botulinum CFSAN002369]ABS33651.1 methionine ABC transporter, MUT family, permease protein [Clostridium botulinum A str. ATCC 19397]ABS38211.1 methionine ABC transporter, MUT family, permease protein [Clostridium botulinum A str. Hall]APC84165.1 binding--dependent transport system inner membran
MLQDMLFKALKETLYMVSISTILSISLGFIPSIILIITDEKGLKPNKVIYKSLDFVVNLLRSFPFIILMVAILPFTKAIVGKTIGTTAAIVPLTIAAIPFATRVLESAMKEVDEGVIEAAKSLGASDIQIIFKVIIKESMPSMIVAITLTIISVVAYSAMAGAIGGGGLGDVAIKYGYYRFKTDIMIYTVVILIILVQVIQSLGNILYKRLDK